MKIKLSEDVVRFVDEHSGFKSESSHFKKTYIVIDLLMIDGTKKSIDIDIEAAFEPIWHTISYMGLQGVLIRTTLEKLVEENINMSAVDKVYVGWYFKKEDNLEEEE